MYYVDVVQNINNTFSIMKVTGQECWKRWVGLNHSL